MSARADLPPRPLPPPDWAVIDQWLQDHESVVTGDAFRPPVLGVVR